MSIKKRIKAGRIEPSADGTAVVVHFTTEITHFDEDGSPSGTERIPDRKEVPVGKAIRKARAEDLPTLAQEIADKCRYIPDSKVRQVELVLAKLFAARMPVSASPSPPPPEETQRPLADSVPRRTPRSTPPQGRRRTRGDMHRSVRSLSPAALVVDRPADVLPEALVDRIDDYAEQLYEEEMDAKAAGARRLLRLCTDVHALDEISTHPTLLGVLSRELRENAKRSRELAVAITGIFLCLGHFSQFHSALGRHHCGEATLRVVEFESKRVKALHKELKLAQGRLNARGAEASREERERFEREERRYEGIVERQERLVLLCVMILRDIAEDVSAERKMVGLSICELLMPLLSRRSDEFLLSVLGFLHKLSVFLVNKDTIVKNTEAMGHLAELTCHSSADIALLALRLCYNLSFDPYARKLLATQTGLVARLIATFQLPHFRAVSLKLLYHLSMDAPIRALISSKHSACVGTFVHLVARGREQHLEREAVALSINLATGESSASLMVEVEHFPDMVQRAVQQGDPLLLKIVRGVTAHKAVRVKLLRLLQMAKGGCADWLYDLVRLACRTSDRPEVIVEALGILANLDCASPIVPWPELCGLGLLDLLHRLMMVGFSEDDVLLECLVLSGVLALDPACAPLLAASKVPTDLSDLMVEKQEDGDIMVQLLFSLRCLLLQEETCEVVLQETDAPERVLDLLEAYQQASDAKAVAVQTGANSVLDLIVALEEQDDLEPRWSERIKAYRFEVHNLEWVQMLRRGEEHKPVERKPLENKTAVRWTDVGALADRCWGGSSGIW